MDPQGPKRPPLIDKKTRIRTWMHSGTQRLGYAGGLLWYDSAMEPWVAITD